MLTENILTIVFLMMCACVIYPPTEFQLAGFTIESIFARYLGVEHQTFILYHLRKSCLNLFVYSLLPLGYLLVLFLGGYYEMVTALFDSSFLWKIFSTTSIVLPLFAIFIIISWTRNKYQDHPIAFNLSKFCNNSWRQVAKDISIEFSRVDKVVLRTSAITKVIVTENWIIKVMPLTLYVIHQSDASLVVKDANTYELSQTSNGNQFLTIEIKSARRNVDPVQIRINAADFKDLKDRIARSIEILPSVKFHVSVIDQFIEVFKDTIKDNPPYETSENLDLCIGCMQVKPSVKLQKLCENAGPVNDRCSECYCKPLWCVDCMGRWFASRQDSSQQNKWLSSKCTCPMCRATFCLLDVCEVRELP